MSRKKAACPSRRGARSKAGREHYYYRLRKLRQAACTALEQAQPLQLAEVPLAPKQKDCQARFWLTTKSGTLEIWEADRSVLDQVLQVMLHAE